MAVTDRGTGEPIRIGTDHSHAPNINSTIARNIEYKLIDEGIKNREKTRSIVSKIAAEFQEHQNKIENLMSLSRYVFNVLAAKLIYN